MPSQQGGDCDPAEHSYMQLACACPLEERVSALQGEPEAPPALPKAEMTPDPNTQNKKSTTKARTKDLHVKQAELVSILLELGDRNGSSTIAIRDALSRRHGAEPISMGSIRQALQRAVRAGDIELNSANYRFKLNPSKFSELTRFQNDKKGRKQSRGRRKRSKGRKGKKKKKKKKKGRGRRRRRRSRKRGKKKGRGRRRRKKKGRKKKGKRKPKAKPEGAAAEAPPAEADMND